jgi:4-alpha-glucanotransferase
MDAPDPAAWGVAPGHHHVHGEWVPAPSAGIDAALAAMGADRRAPVETPTWVVRRSDGLRLPWAGRLITEDGDGRDVADALAPGELPLGYHTLAGPPGEIRLIVSPGVCPLPRRSWGWAVQLYGARSGASWGIGDLGDLRRLAAWTAESGGGLLLLSPLHGVAPGAEQEASPYYPASRRWRNPIYLRVEDVPGAEAVDLGGWTAEGRALNRDRHIDRDRAWRLKRAALTRIWEAGTPPPDFTRWADEQGPALEGWATWAALCDGHGPDWRRWPEALQRPDGAAVAQWRAAHAREVRFHAWLQWLVELQLVAAAGPGPALVSDLAVGANPAGADGWQWQDVLAWGVSVGAPPDEFNTGGQDWGFPPFDPWRLRAAGYEPFAQLVRASMGGGGGVRIDHVAGLSRLFWVPTGASPSLGVYVRYPWEDLLNVVALEASRAGAFVVGEDLGTVEPEFRAAMGRWGILSYRLLWFEDAPPDQWPERALAAVTTHDLPTVRGVWTGSDVAARATLGLDPEAEAGAGRRLRRRLEAVCGDVPTEEAVVRAYGAVASSPCVLVAATLDDALLVEERPNQPGVVEGWPNWSLALPEPLEDLELDPHVKRLAAALAEGRAR